MLPCLRRRKDTCELRMRSTDPVFDLAVSFCGQSETVTVPRALITLVGDIKTALLLSQVIWWSQKKESVDGWFYKTADDWFEEIALTRHEVDRSTAELESLEVIETKVQQVNGIPKKHYRFSTSGFRECICKKAEVHLQKSGSPGFVKKRKSYKEQKNTTEENIQKNTSVDHSRFAENENQNPGTASHESGDPEPGLDCSAPAIAQVEIPDVPQETFSPWNVSDTVRILKSNFNAAKPSLKIDARTKEKLTEALERLNQDGIPEQTVWDARDEFLERDRSGMYNAAAVFVKMLYEFASGSSNRTPRRRAAAAPVQSRTPSPTPDTPQRTQGLPARVEQWNVLVPAELRVEFWTAESPWQSLAGAEANPEFVARFPEICARVSKCHTVGRITPTFAWLFALSKGQVNWWRVANGLFAWAEKPEGGPPGKTSAVSPLLQQVRDRIAARKAAKSKGLEDGENGSEPGRSGGDAHSGVGVSEGQSAVGGGLEGPSKNAA